MLARSKILILVAMFAALNLSACNYITGGKDNSTPPSPLTEIKAEKKFTKLWSVQTGKGDNGQYLKLKPLILSNSTLTVDVAGLLQSHDLSAGKLQWQKKLNQEISQGVSGSDEIVFVSTSHGEVFALDPTDGKQFWQKKLVKNILNNPVVDQKSVYIQTSDGTLYSLDKLTGKENWSYRLQNPDLTLYTTSSPIVWKNLVIAGFASGKLIVFDKMTGMPKWNYQIAQPSGNTIINRMVDIAAEPLIIDNMLYVVSYQGKMKAIDLDNGKISWQYDMSAINNVSFNSKYLYVSDTEGKVWALNRYNGRVLWKQEKLYMRDLSGSDYIDNTVVVGDYAGYLHGLSTEHGGIIARTKLTNSGIRVAPQVKNGIIYVLDTNGMLAAYKLDVS